MTDNYYFLVAFILVGLILLERFVPVSKGEADFGRIVTNIGLAAMNHYLFRFAMVALFLYLPKTRINDSEYAPTLTLMIAEGLIGFVILDFMYYLIHRAFHRFSWLWRVHKLHHSDLELDFTTSLRHHPLELALVLLLASPVIFLLELGWATVAFYILVSELVALCAHSNIRLPQRIDSALSKVLVTPSFHRRHHSRHRRQTDSHYGQIFTIWDHLFRSYAPYNVASDTEVEIGLNQYPRSEDTHLHKALTLPFTQHKPDQ